jgi:hypothetical protein
MKIKGEIKFGKLGFFGKEVTLAGHLDSSLV